MNLYQATQLAKIESHVNEDTGEIDIEAWKLCEVSLLEKQRATVAYINNQISESEAISGVIKKLQDRKKQSDKRIDRLKDWLAFNMRQAGVSEIKADDLSFSAKLHLDRDVSVEIVDGYKFPPELCNEPKPPEPSKTKIKAAIESGQVVAGATIVRKDRLTIK